MLAAVLCLAAAGFSAPTLARTRPISTRLRDCRCSEPDGDDTDAGASLGERLDNLLDQQVFDPTEPSSSDEPKVVSEFKNLVNTDYELAEALWVGGVFAVLIFISQAAVRVYKHCVFMPDAQCPWDANAGSTLADTLLKLQ